LETNAILEKSVWERNVKPTTTLHEEQRVGVFPNPFTNKITLETKSPIRQIEVFNSIGQKQNSSFQKSNIDLVEIITSDLPQGLYLVYIYFENGNYAVEKLEKRN
jgi:hypothetical protein